MAVFNLVQKVFISATTADGAGPKDVTIPTAIKLGSAYPVPSVRDNRTGSERGATIDIFDANTVRMSWDGVLGATETIDATVFIFDIENLGDDLKEILFRLQRVLGYHGENTVQDLIAFDEPGNIITYRLRLFKDKAAAEDATIDNKESLGLEAGEIAQIKVTADYDQRNNDRISLVETLENLGDTPDIG